MMKQMKNAETMPVVTIISEMITLLQLVCVILVMIDTSGSISTEKPAQGRNALSGLLWFGFISSQALMEPELLPGMYVLFKSFKAQIFLDVLFRFEPEPSF